MAEAKLEDLFPGLRVSRYRLTSPASPDYNCIAWAASQQDAWWWPDEMHVSFWPAAAPRQETIEAFVEAFSTLGYTPCDIPDWEPGFEKIAIYADDKGTPTHAAKQLPTGAWTSKLGALEDVEHQGLYDLTGSRYGTVVRFLKRPIPH